MVFYHVVKVTSLVVLLVLGRHPGALEGLLGGSLLGGILLGDRLLSSDIRVGLVLGLALVTVLVAILGGLGLAGLLDHPDLALDAGKLARGAPGGPLPLVVLGHDLVVGLARVLVSITARTSFSLIEMPGGEGG